MKRSICLSILFAVFLCGCSHIPVSETVVPSETVAITTPETTVSVFTEPEPAEPEPTETLSPAEQLLERLSLEEKVGQLFLARCPDIQAVEDVQTYHLGGYVLFGRDFENRSPEQVQQTLESYQKAAAVPLLIAVDEEGGDVTRVSCYSQFRSSKFSSPRYLFQQGGMDLIRQTEEEKCQLLKSLGINVNLAPVCDITTDSGSFMYRRSLGQSPELTGQFVAETVGIMSQYGIGSALKHFPGYGNNVDTHTGVAVDERSLSQLEGCDLVPFAGGIEAGCGAIMVSHTVVGCFDAEHPASLSYEVHRYLREDMGFDGVIVTDDLVMEAITDKYGAEDAAVLAVLAGNDLLCSTQYQVQYGAVLEAVKSERISEEQLNRSVLRILQWKADIGLLEEETL